MLKVYTLLFEDLNHLHVNIVNELCVLQLIGGLADEKERWKDSVETLDKIINNFVGDVMISAGYVAYLGPFTVSL